MRLAVSRLFVVLRDHFGVYDRLFCSRHRSKLHESCSRIRLSPSRNRHFQPHTAHSRPTFSVSPVSPLDPEYAKNIHRLLLGKNPQSNFVKLLAEQYNGHGLFSRELGIVLLFCLNSTDIRKICSNFQLYAGILKLLVMDRQLMVIEEVFSSAYRNYTATAIIMRQLIELEIITLGDYLHFLRITNTNHTLYGGNVEF